MGPDKRALAITLHTLIDKATIVSVGAPKPPVGKTALLATYRFLTP